LRSRPTNLICFLSPPSICPTGLVVWILQMVWFLYECRSCRKPFARNFVYLPLLLESRFRPPVIHFPSNSRISSELLARFLEIFIKLPLNSDPSRSRFSPGASSLFSIPIGVLSPTFFYRAPLFSFPRHFAPLDSARWIYLPPILSNSLCSLPNPRTSTHCPLPVCRKIALRIPAFSPTDFLPAPLHHGFDPFS